MQRTWWLVLAVLYGCGGDDLPATGEELPSPDPVDTMPRTVAAPELLLADPARAPASLPS